MAHRYYADADAKAEIQRFFQYGESSFFLSFFLSIGEKIIVK